MTDEHDEGETEEEKREREIEGIRLILTSGLLFEANDKIFNPYGIALGTNPERTELKVVFNLEHPENFVYPKEVYNQARKKRDNWMKTVGNFILKLRKKRLGYIVQGPNDNTNG